MGVNPLRGEALFKAGDVEKTLVVNINVFVELEEATGYGISELVDRIQDSPSFTLLRHIFCAALQTKHPGTTLAQTGDIMSDAGMTAITEALKTVIKAAMPEAKKGPADPPKPAAAKVGTG